ncbi:pseudouridine synthase [Cognatishimia sp. SS12]|uniref:pseudouridine synthase n=1 Tax=Cognatishimia sp. SS12 TaxID=2979465 RepID=UPI00232B1AD9|nr:pseudouridine synthase [Cognatishimia sp. SS12]MDC0738634.1 pseudouridine synthase [Cognatishimia sp. SS12]
MTRKPQKPASNPAASSATEGDRIAKVLARAGVASRREAERMIEAGRVSVNGKVLTSPAFNVTETARILVDGKPLAEKEPERLWLYHKPVGRVTTHKDEKDRATIFDDLPDTMPKHVMTIGRLDLNSEGLLLLTNDGDVKRKLELPSTGWVRKYRVRVNGRPNEARFQPLRDGITVDGEHFAPMDLVLDRQQGANAWVTVALREGKNREIRRAMEAIDLKVNRLIRISYGPFQLGDLKPGAVEELRRRVVRDQLGLDGAVPPEERKTPARRRKAPQRDAAPKPHGTDLSDMTPTRKRPGKPTGGKPHSGKPGGPRKSAGGRPAGSPNGKPTGKFQTGKPRGKR